MEAKTFILCTSILYLLVAVLRVTKLRKQSRIVTALILPLIVLIWVFGWTLYWIGNQRKEKGTATPLIDRDNVQLIVSTNLEEEQLKMQV